MSVINQMLKDLGARQSRSELRLADMLDRQTPAMTLSRRYLPAAGPALMVLAGALVTAGMLWQQTQRGAANESAVERVPVASVPAAPVRAATVIGAIGIEADGESLRLVFESAKLLPVTQAYNADGGIDYVFANAKLDAPLPALGENPFIASYALTRRGADLVLRLVPSDSARAFIETGSAAGGDSYRTVIGARAHNVPVATAAPKAPVAEPRQATTASRPAAAGARKPAPAHSAPAAAETTAEAGKIGITRSVTPERQAEAYYRQGLEKLQADRVEAAVSDLRRAIELQPGLHAARELLAALLLRGGHGAEAHAELRQGMRLDPAYTAYARLYAQSLLEAGDPAGALQALAASEPYAAQQSDYRAFMAAVAQRLARHEESVGHYTAALALKPSRSPWWVGLAISLEALGRAQEAAQAYRTALSGNELNADLMDYARARAAELDKTGRGG